MISIAIYLFLSPATTVTATTTIRVPSTMEEEITIDAGSILSFKETREEKISRNECVSINLIRSPITSRPMSRFISID